jgi:hypothetical protein
MEREMRNSVPCQADESRILYQHPVRTLLIQEKQKLRSVRKFPLCEESIYGHIDFYIRTMGIFKGTYQLGFLEVLRICSGAVSLSPQIHCVRSRAHSGHKGFP